MRPAPLLLVVPVLAGLAACSSGTRPAPAPTASAAPSASATPAVVPAANVPAAIANLLQGAAAREEITRGQTGVYLDAQDLGLIVDAGVIFEAIPSFDGYCLDASVTAGSPRYQLNSDNNGVITAGECPRPDQLTGPTATASP